MRLRPASTKASRSWKEVGGSMVQPKTLPPKARGATVRPELPSGRRVGMVPPGKRVGLPRGGGVGEETFVHRHNRPLLAVHESISDSGAGNGSFDGAEV